MNLIEFYDKNYKKLMLIPLLMLVLSIIIIAAFYSKNSDVMNKDVSLKGGITATVYIKDPISIASLEQSLNKEFNDALVRKLTEFGSENQIGLIIEVGTEDEASVKSFLEQNLNMQLTEENYSVEVSGSAIGETFYKQMLIALLLAFIFMSIIIIIIFRTFIPSIAVIFAALADIIVTLAFIDLIGQRISTAGIAAFLLIIGYSVDTDVLLTTHVLKRKEGSITERIFRSMKTGLTMTITTITASIVGYFLSEAKVFKEIFLIILVAMIVDVISTYLMNAAILKIYAEKKEHITQ